MFSLDSLGGVARALQEANSAAMLDIVFELERSGRSLQHFARELSRYIRNLLVKKIAPGNPRLIAASPAEHDRLKEVAAPFSEEDLTRYLQIALDIFRELQYALQPRLHLELGLLRMIYAGRLVSIEEALASAGGGTSVISTKPKAVAAGKSVPHFAEQSQEPPRITASSSQPRVAPPPTVTPAPAAPLDPGDWRGRLHAALMEMGMPHTADAVEQAEVTATANELTFVVASKLLQMTINADVPKVIQQVAGKAMKITVKVGKQTGAAAPVALAAPAQKGPEDETTQRALEHPEVKRFQELFPEGQVRQVRNLKD